MYLTSGSSIRPIFPASHPATRFRERNAICIEASAQPGPGFSVRQKNPCAQQSALYLMAQLQAGDRSRLLHDPHMVAQSYQAGGDFTGRTGLAARI